MFSNNPRDSKRKRLEDTKAFDSAMQSNETPFEDRLQAIEQQLQSTSVTYPLPVAAPKLKRRFVAKRFVMAMEASSSALESHFQSLAVVDTPFEKPRAPVLLSKPTPMRPASVLGPVAIVRPSETTFCLLEGQGRIEGRCRASAITSASETRGPQELASVQANGGMSPF